MMDWITPHHPLFFVLSASACGLIYALACIAHVFSVPSGEPKLQKPHHAIKEGAYAFLLTQYGTIVTVGFLVLAFPVVESAIRRTDRRPDRQCRRFACRAAAVF